MEVEEIAVAKIQSMVGRCPHLKPYITTNDKTPFTDGHIDIYRGLARKRDDWRGRVSVQVKGRTNPGKAKSAVTFPISRTDLLAFQKDGGVLYFYVAVNKKGKSAPFYALLSPFTIGHFLLGTPEEQASISIPFKKFPNTPAQIEQILSLALKTKDQRPSTGFDLELFENMKSITVYTAADLSLDAPLTLDPGEVDFALELVTVGGMTHQLDGGLSIMPQAYVEQAVDVSIGAGGVTFDRIGMRRIDAQTVEAVLDGGIRLTMTEDADERSWNVHYTAQSNLAERIKATEFLLGLVEQGGVEINGAATHLGTTTVDAVKLADELRGHLEAMRPLRELFEYLGVNMELIELDELDGEQHFNLSSLYRLLVGGEEYHDAAGEVSRGLMHVGKWEVMLMSIPGTEPDRWKYVNPLDPAAPQMFRLSAKDGTADDAMPVTTYDIIEQEHLPRILNLRLESIVEAYEPIADAEKTTSLANQRVLALILAADVCPQRQDEFLTGAELLNEWLIAHEGEQAVHMINRWQLRWRRGKLSPADLTAIRGLKRQVVKRGGDLAAEAEISCSLLLDDQDDVDYLISQMSREKLAAVQAWPIWRLRYPRENATPPAAAPHT